MSITEHRLVQKARRRLERHGLANTLHLAGVRLLSLFVPFRILRGMAVEKPNLAFLSCPRPYRPGFVPPARLVELAGDPASELAPRFVSQALLAGDECYAICDGGKLVSYGWHSLHATPLGPPELVVHFSPGYVYRYKGFTAAGYRGRRLHAIGMTRALVHYRTKGYRGLICYVESTNFDSMKSCARMGYEVFGSVYLLRIFGRTFAFSTPGCKRFGFRIQCTAPRAVTGRSASARPAGTHTS